MNIYKISQTENNQWDAAYEFAIVVAESEAEARNMRPWFEAGAGFELLIDWEKEQDRLGCWCLSPEQVVVEYLGEAAPGLTKGIIHAHWIAG